MNADQFALAAYQWVVGNVLPGITSEIWKQQLIVFKKGRDIIKNLRNFSDGLDKDANGNVDLADLEARIDEMLKINPVFAYPVNEPMLALIGVEPEHVLKFSKTDFASFLSSMRGTTTTTQVTL